MLVWLIFIVFELSGSGLFENPSGGVLEFSEFELDGLGTFIPFYRPTKDYFELPDFRIIGVGVFEIPFPFYPDEIEKEIFEINRRQLELKSKWGIDGGFGCDKPQKPYRCIVYSDKLFLGELDPINENRPELLSSKTSTQAQSQYDIIAADGPDDLAKEKAEARQLARIGDPRHESIEEEERIAELPRFLTNFHVSMIILRPQSKPGTIKKLAIKEEKQESHVEPAKPKASRKTKETRPNIPPTRIRSSFHRSIPRTKRQRKSGRVREIGGKINPKPADIEFISPSSAKLQHTAVAEPDAPAGLPYYLNDLQSGLRGRKRRS